MIQTYRLYSWADWLKIVLALSKIRISQMVAASTLVGYLLASQQHSWLMLVATLGTFLLSCGSAALNQYQEWEYDREMNRTRLRPIPAEKISPLLGLGIALGLMLSGSLILLLGCGLPAMLLGVFNVFWYNAVYTPLKRVTPFAVVPGSLIGAIPPAIGWVAAGGSLLDPQIWVLGSFFFIWQVPHFWLLMLNLSGDYERAGFPTLSDRFTPAQLARITFSWIIATVVTSLMIPFYGLGNSIWLVLALLGCAVWLLWGSRKLLAENIQSMSFRFAFKGINIYMLLVMTAFTLDRLIFA